MNEYISREMAIKRIKHVKPHVVMSEYGAGYERGIKDAIGILNATPTIDVQPVKRGQWISVKDRLPEDTEPCVVVTKNNGLGVSRLIGRNELEWMLFGEPVLYWMSLPEPPKDGEQNAKT